MKYETKDGREWSMMLIKNMEIEMLWDSGASITVMNERTWKKIGSPKLDTSNLIICGVFPGGKAPLGQTKIDVEWNKKRRNINVLIIKEISPGFIGGVDTMKAFGIRLMEINNIETDSMKMNITDKDRIQKAKLEIAKDGNEKINKLIEMFGSIFMATRFDLGFTKRVEHHIKTSGKPVMQYPRRQPMHLEQKVEDMVKNLQEAGVIRKCQSPWNAPLVIVGKKDGSIRMCVDYRGLNAITEKESFPMPEIKHLLDCLAGSKFFSSLDLGQAYYQVALAEDSQDKTAFSTKEGQFCFNRLPFGLATAPATFQRLMHEMLTGILFNGAIVYLDDILVYGRNQEEHDQRLQEVFQRIKDTGLKINPEKCEIYKEKLLFLGHTVSQSGIRTNEDKIRVINNASRPKCSKQLRSFLGLTNYYRRFIKDYARIAAPLHAATTGCEKTIQWSEDCENSFNKMKEALTMAPTLEYPRKDRIFVLDTDACFEAIGSVLSQITETGDEVVIAYGSRHMTPHERGYCVTRKELLALHEYIMHFRQYLYGKKFIARTDHKALVFMNTTKSAISPQFQTWMTNLSEYDFQLQYRKGVDHGNADGLSRIGGILCAQCQTAHEEPKKEKSKVRYINSLMKTATMTEILEEQRKDHEFQDARNYIEGTNDGGNMFDNSFLFKIKDQIKIVDDLVVFVDGHNDRIVVPLSYQEKLTRDIHTDLCHIGGKKLFHYMETNFFFPKMVETVQQIVRKCSGCAKRKIDQGRTKEILIPRESSEFLEEIVIDIAHMGKVSTENKYVIVIVDRFSKLVFLTAVPSQDEKTVFKTLLHKWIYKYGKPRTILSDRGRNFESGYLRKQLEKLGIEQTFATPYQHQSNGLVERVIRTMRDWLVISMKENAQKMKWYELIPKIEFCINATVQSATKCSPFEIVYGRKITLHASNKLQIEDREDIIDRAKFSAYKATEHMRTFENDKRGNREFKVGEEVLVRREPHRRQKDDDQYDGPYTILRFLSERQVELQYPKGKRLRRIEWLKKSHLN
jgi:predicted aspartyl protease